MPCLKRAHPVMQEKVFVTVPLMKRVISMEMEMFPELLFQIVNRASGRVSCTETWNYSQIINEGDDSDDSDDTSDNDNPLNDSDSQSLPPRKQVRASTATKRGVYCSATKQKRLEIFGFYGFWKFLNEVEKELLDSIFCILISD